MIETIKGILDKDWKRCPSCQSEIVSAVANGFQVPNLVAPIPTDLMLCFDCKRLYVVFPSWHLKRQPKKRREYPKDFDLYISPAVLDAKAEMIRQYEITQKTISAIRAKEE